MNLFHVVWRTLFSLLVLFLLTRLVGARQVSNFSLFDYINSITIGSIAAEMAISPDENVLYPLIAMILYGLSVYFVSLIERKFPKSRKFLIGKPKILFQNGKFDRKNFKKSNLTVDEFSALLRAQGHFDLTGVRAVVLEENGGLSVEPKEENRPAEPCDLGLHPADPAELIPLIEDGKILPGGLRRIGKDEVWLDRRLTELSEKPSGLFLAVGDTDGRFYAYPIAKSPSRSQKD